MAEAHSRPTPPGLVLADWHIHGPRRPAPHLQDRGMNAEVVARLVRIQFSYPRRDPRTIPASPKGNPMSEPRAAGVIAPGLFLRGELRGEDDLIIEGRVEGQITLKKHLTVETTGVIVADVQTQNITIKGEMRGNMIAEDKV